MGGFFMYTIITFLYALPNPHDYDHRLLLGLTIL